MCFAFDGPGLLSPPPVPIAWTPEPPRPILRCAQDDIRVKKTESAILNIVKADGTKSEESFLTYDHDPLHGAAGRPGRLARRAAELAEARHGPGPAGAALMFAAPFGLAAA